VHALRAWAAPQVTVEAVVAMNRVILGCGTLLFAPVNHNQEVFENLVHGWTGLLTSGDQDACVAAAQCIHSFVECDEGQVPSARDACPHVGVKRCCRLPRRDTNNRGWLCCFGFLQAIVVMWPYMEEMVTLVGRLVSHLAHRQGQETVLHAKTAAALATLFRCTPGETLLRRRVQRCAGCECATSVDTGQRFV